MKRKTKKLAKGIFVRYTIATLCLISVLTISMIHSVYIDKNLKNVTRTYITEITTQSAEMVDRQIYSDLLTLELLAKLIGEIGVIDINKIGDIIIKETTIKGYSNIGIISPEGNYLFSSNAKISGIDYNFNVADREYFKKAISGKLNISNTIISRATKEEVNVYAAPIYKSNKIIGVLTASTNNRVFSNSLFIKTFKGETLSYVVDANGKIIFNTDYKTANKEYKSIFEKYLTGIAKGERSEDQITKDLSLRKPGSYVLQNEEDNIYVSYQPLKINGWVYISVVPENVVKTHILNTQDDILRYLGYVFIILIATIGYFNYIRSQNSKLLREQMKEQSINDTSYRIIMDQTNDILFEYNTIKKTYIYSANFKKTFGYEPAQKGFFNTLKKSYINPEDFVHVVNLYKEMIVKKGLVKSEVRILKANGEPIWTQIQMTGVYDNDGNLVRVIGKIVDIDEQKKAMETLKEKAVLDSATGLFNKQTTEDLIIEFLNNEGKNGKHALLIIDIDDFKDINDEFGHRKGDLIIAELGAEISKMFRTSDIIGRIGGDEFMILIKNIEEMDIINEKAKAICNIFIDKEFGPGKTVTVSTSIGIALFDEDGKSYEELYEAADQALYNSKGVEKGTFTFYNSNQLKFNISSDK